LEITENVRGMNLKVHNPFSTPRNKFTKSIMNNKPIRDIAIRFIPQFIRWQIREKILTKQDGKPKMSEEEISLLKNIYKDDVVNLQKLLNIKLSWLK